MTNPFLIRPTGNNPVRSGAGRPTVIGGPTSPPPPPPPTGSYVFESHWTNSAGTTSNARTDGGAWTELTSFSPDWCTIVERNTVHSNGNAPTYGRVMRVNYENGGHLALPDYLPSLSNGQSLYYGLRLSVDIRNAVGNLSASPHHPIQPYHGSCASTWNFKIGPRSDSTFEFAGVTDAAYPDQGFGRRFNLSKNTWYHWAWRVQKISGTTHKMQFRLNGVDDGDNWLVWDGTYPSGTINARNPDFPMTDACLRNFFLGNNGPGWGGLDPSQDFIYWANVQISTSDWVAP